MKKILGIMLTIALLVTSGCTGNADSSSTDENKNTEENVQTDPADKSIVRISSLKGPTTMGMVKMMENSDNGVYSDAEYQVGIYSTADEIVTQLVKGEIDIANIPCNLASVIFNNTEGKISVALINTMSTLYIVESGTGINSIEDLKGKKIYSTGKGTTPEYILNYILQQNNINPGTEVEIEYKSESAEVAALLETDKNAVALLPQPYITIAQNANSDLRMALNMQDEWSKVNADNKLVTGVTVVRKEFLEKNPAAFEKFMERYKESENFVISNHEEAAGLIADYGIVPEPVAKKALPFCSVSFITGDEMKNNINGYLQVLFDSNPQSVGGALPDESFFIS